MSQRNDSLSRFAARQAAYSAATVAVSTVVWAVSTDAGGYFWPGWVLVAALLGFITRVGRAALAEAYAARGGDQPPTPWRIAATHGPAD
jgi:hypothetical protein